MTCKEKILSDAYADAIIDYDLPERFSSPTEQDYCIYNLDDK